eukprot:m51a1_g5754 putative poc1 centriolar protein homolog a (393) ;mRNA; f:1197626-1199312
MASEQDPCLERSFRGHKGAVTGVSFAPSMRQLATSSADSCVLLWGLHPQLRAFRFVGHRAPVSALSFSPTGHLLASASLDHTVRLWIPNVRGESTVLKAHNAPIRGVDWSRNGRYLVTCSDDKTAKVWAVQGLRFECTLAGHANWVRSARWSHDGRSVATASDDRTVKLWDFERRFCTHTLAEHTSPVEGVVAAGARDGVVNVWDARAARLTQHYGGAHAGAVNSVEFHAGGHYVLTASDDATLKVWDLRAGHLFYTLHGHEGPVVHARFSPEGDYFASGGVDKMVMIWRTNFDRNGAADGSQPALAQGDQPRSRSLSPARDAPASEPTPSGAEHQQQQQQQQQQTPRWLEEAIESIVAKMEIMTQTLSMIDERLGAVEDKTRELDARLTRR